MVSAPSVQLTLSAVPESAATARHRVRRAAQRAGATHAALSAIDLGVSEACTNAIVHAFRDGRDPGRLDVTVACEATTIEVAVCDDGMGMQPRTDSPGLGLGLALMGTVADHVDIDASASGGTRVRL